MTVKGNTQEQELQKTDCFLVHKMCVYKMHYRNPGSTIYKMCDLGKVFTSELKCFYF